ncbi:hypothetical protein GCM10007079_12880 [Nocardiopsis terrae]|uniref:DUF2207 domain-containing protein n=1 Tax=Nocardiopsis terrae TaxID=372655 RepID=A0ABR9HBV4_9ACTN|nr:hypothetical protein [Nocardiopsis terrae]MBE1456504.1 hypothetical protein [Nocardiopsis terrae]GHC76511.1 hypothetical protein GCM10007079_12880 [Nocardiopsis terrae]
MKLTFPDGHIVQLTPWLLQAVLGAFPLPGDEGRLAPYEADPSAREMLIREGAAAHDGNGDFVLTGHGLELHRLATASAPGSADRETEGGRLTCSPELTPEELARVREAEAQLRAGARAFRRGEPLPARVRYPVGVGLLLPPVGAFLVEWHLDVFGLPLAITLIVLILVAEWAAVGAIHRYRRARQARAPGEVLRRHAKRCLAPAALDPVSRGLLLRVQRVVDGSADPAALAGQEWELARELAGYSLRRSELEGLTDPDEHVLGLIDLLADLARTEERVRELEAASA